MCTATTSSSAVTRARLPSGPRSSRRHRAEKHWADTGARPLAAHAARVANPQKARLTSLWSWCARATVRKVLVRVHVMVMERD